MIKSKIEARERALELAASLFATAKQATREEFFSMTKEIEGYLIGDANLPEMVDDNAHIKELLEIANKSFDNSRKFSNEGFGGNAGMAMGFSRVPAKSDDE